MNTPCSVLSALYVVGFSFELVAEDDAEDEAVEAFGILYEWVWMRLLMDVNRSR